MYLLCKRVIKLIPGPECLQWPSISSNIVNPLDLLNPPSLLFRQQFDHAIWYHGFWLPTMFDHVRRWCDCGVWPWSVVAENLLHFPSEEICHQKYFLTAKATINSSLKHRRPFFRKRCVLKVSLTILISHCSSEIPYFQVQWRTFSILMYSIKFNINVLYFLK